MSNICFVTEELFPVAPGGAGMLIYNSIRALKQRGHTLTVLLESSPEVLKKAREEFQGKEAGEVRLDGLYGVAELTADLPESLMSAFGSWYPQRSYRLYRALARVMERERIDWVEFNDFFGPAYYSLAAKASGLAFGTTQVGVRLHSPWELLVASGDGAMLTPDLMQLRAMERASLRLAEQILSPSENYARDVYGCYYPPGLGDIHVSKPEVLAWPQKKENAGGKRNLILFYGRLHPCKGLDRLLPAALEVAYRNSECEFGFIGGDSNSARDQGDSYRALMQAKIPPELGGRFHFFGRLNFDQVGELLGRTRLAVFASYLESFCYAAQELKHAGVPLLVVNSPVFLGMFKDQRDAVIFDGRVDDLAGKMQNLFDDAALRERIAQPCLPGDAALGEFYDRLPQTSWMNKGTAPCRSLVVIVCDGGGNASTTVQSVRDQLGADDELLLLEKPQPGMATSPVVWLDRTWSVRRPDGRLVDADEVRSKEALLVLWAGDTLGNDTLPRWRYALQHRQALMFATGWRQTADGLVDVRSFETCLESLLFTPRGLGQRALMRTSPGRRLEDIFDPRLGILGEIGHLWSLDEQGSGVCVPEVMVRCRAEAPVVPIEEHPSTVSYLVTRDRYVPRQKSLSYWATIAVRQSAISARRLRSPEERLAEATKADATPAELREEIGQLFNDLTHLRNRCEAAEGRIARMKSSIIWRALSKSNRMRHMVKKLILNDHSKS